MPARTRSQNATEAQNGKYTELPTQPAADTVEAWSSAADRPSLVNDSERGKSRTKSRNVSKGADVPPTHTINLALPPEQRYVELALQYKDQIADLVGLFDEVVMSLGIKVSVQRIKQIARLLLRRVHDSEQTRELRGISKATGVDMYLMVAFNVLLDLFMGCTSGGVKINEGGKSKMVHFRTLDWGMDVLRRVVVQLEYVECEDGPVIARSVTYVGFVGVLTGVREGLSISLNFRGLHNNAQSVISNILYAKTLLLVLLGFKPSIACTLRHLLLPSMPNRAQIWRRKWTLPTLAYLRNRMTSISTTACYLIFSDGKETMTIEKDRVSGVVQRSKVLITATNHDAGHADASVQAAQQTPDVTGMAELVEESLTRRGCVEKCYKDAVDATAGGSISMADVEKWMSTYPILNECTHYAVIMDPTEGTVRYARRWINPYKPSKAERRLYPCPWHA